MGTSTGAFVGLAEKGVVGKAALVTNWSQFVKEYGEFIPNGYLAYSVYSFFAEGGTSCYVVRAASDSAVKSFNTIQVDSTDVVKVTARTEGTWGDRITLEIGDPSDRPDATHFKLTVKYAKSHEAEYVGEISEEFDDIFLENIQDTVNEVSNFISVETLSDTNKRPDNGTYPLTGGADGIKDADFIGDPVNKKGLHAFDEVDDINIVAIPDKAGDREVVLAGLNYCKNRKDCFFIADPPYGYIPTEVVKFKKGTDVENGGQAFNSSYGALYYPWLYINDPLTGKKKLVPPSGAVIGTYAHTDSVRGAHKAPAGVAEGYLDSVVGIERIVTKGEHDLLNPAGINVIRTFTSGICLWGTRTLSSDSEWKYINVRRLLLFIEESIDEGTQWVVFEPNDISLWGSIKRNITAFLLTVWRDGALFGTTSEEAFFVKVDEENNPPEVRDAGRATS